VSGELFAPLFEPARLREELSARAWVDAMLETEAALAAASADAGVIPVAAADAIAAACRSGSVQTAGLGDASLVAGNPVVPLVERLREAVGGEAAGYVHWGATSQDVLDTAAMLVARRALALIVEELDGVARACARQAREHARTLMAGRTLLQQALPVTFGLKAAGWLDATLDARAGLLRARLDAQLGGAAGTLAALGDAGPKVARGLAERLGLGAPELPWHTSRGRVAELGAALAVAAGAMGKLALDLVLLAQTEVGEVRAGAGGSSTLPHKQNPVGAVRARAAAQRVPPLAALLLGAMAQEHERAAGGWHAEWEPLGQALALTGGAAAAVRETLDELEVRSDRMRANLDATGGLLLAERVVFALTPRAGRDEAKAAVQAAAAAADASFRDALVAQPAVAAHLDAAAVDDLLDPAGYLGATDVLVARALARHEREVGA
jgi:3-carboxy-cis,cis-muconate cycloisomerase